MLLSVILIFMALFRYIYIGPDNLTCGVVMNYIKRIYSVYTKWIYSV